MQSQEWQMVTRKDKISIRVKVGNIFFDNKKWQESIYDFIMLQQIYDKKLMKHGSNFAINYQSFISQYWSTKNSKING